MRCRYCRKLFDSILELGKHLHDKHWKEMVLHGKKLKAIRDHKFNGVADYIVLEKENESSN